MRDSEISGACERDKKVTSMDGEIFAERKKKRDR